MELLGLVVHVYLTLLEVGSVLLNRMVRAGFTDWVTFQQRPGGKGSLVDVRGQECSGQRERGRGMPGVFEEQHGGQYGRSGVSEGERAGWCRACRLR